MHESKDLELHSKDSHTLSPMMINKQFMNWPHSCLSYILCSMLFIVGVLLFCYNKKRAHVNQLSHLFWPLHHRCHAQLTFIGCCSNSWTSCSLRQLIFHLLPVLCSVRVFSRLLQPMNQIERASMFHRHTQIVLGTCTVRNKLMAFTLAGIFWSFKDCSWDVLEPEGTCCLLQRLRFANQAKLTR